MRFSCYTLCILHPLPASVSSINLPYRKPDYFRFEIPVGIAVVPDSDDGKFWLHMVDCVDTFPWQVLLASTPSDKDSFLHALNTAVTPLRVHLETCDCWGDVMEMLNSKRDDVETSYLSTQRKLWIEVYGRN